MSTFEVKIREIKEINRIEGADFIELVKIEGFQSVVRKDEFKVGDKVVYIPEQSLVPYNVLKAIGLEDKLSGKHKNRVKAIRLKGIVSQGIVYPVTRAYEQETSLNPEVYNVSIPDSTYKIYANENANLAEVMGIVKWEPQMPSNFSGDIAHNPVNFKLHYDIENFKYFENVFEDKTIYVTEKIHGSFMGIYYNPNGISEEYFEGGKVAIFSKGLGSRGFLFKDTEKNRQSNSYVKKFIEITNEELWKKKIEELYEYNDLFKDKEIIILGELYGRGIQDLDYSELTPDFRVFDIGYKDTTGIINWIHPKLIEEICNYRLNINYVKLLYEGIFNREILDKMRTGDSMFSDNKQIKEGIVIKCPDADYTNNKLGRGILKYINDDYLTRKGNVTEYN